MAGAGKKGPPPKPPKREDAVEAPKPKPPPPPPKKVNSETRKLTSSSSNPDLTDEEAHAQERVLQFAIAIMLCGLIVATVASFSDEKSGTLQLIGSTVSVLGVLVASSAEIDINIYITLSFVVRGGRLSFAFVLLVGMAFCAHAFLVSPASFLPALPMIYALVRFESVVNMRGGFLRFTQLVSLSFVLSCLSWSIYYIQVAINSDPVPPFAYLSTGWLISGIILIQVYRRSMAQGESMTFCFYTALYWYLLFEGSCAFAKAYITENCYSAENPAARSWISSDQHTVKDGEWAIGPVYAAAGIGMLCCRRVVFGRLGRWWLHRQQHSAGTSTGFSADGSTSMVGLGARTGAGAGHTIGAIV
jgi:hypothetical protein